MHPQCVSSQRVDDVMRITVPKRAEGRRQRSTQESEATHAEARRRGGVKSLGLLHLRVSARAAKGVRSKVESGPAITRRRARPVLGPLSTFDLTPACLFDPRLPLLPSAFCPLPSAFRLCDRKLER